MGIRRRSADCRAHVHRPRIRPTLPRPTALKVERQDRSSYRSQSTCCNASSDDDPPSRQANQDAQAVEAVEAAQAKAQAPTTGYAREAAAADKLRIDDHAATVTRPCESDAAANDLGTPAIRIGIGATAPAINDKSFPAATLRWRQPQLRPGERDMLITIKQATRTYDISARTINRRQADGTLTSHTDPDTGLILVDTAELNTIAQARAPAKSPPPVLTAKPEIEPPPTPPIRRDLFGLPHPDEVDAALARASNAPRLPRLFARRQ